MVYWIPLVTELIHLLCTMNEYALNLINRFQRWLSQSELPNSTREDAFGST